MQGVLLELRDLAERQDRLKLILRSSAVNEMPQTELDLLSMQVNAMALYAQCLAMRLSLWREQPEPAQPTLTGLVDNVLTAA